MIAAPFSVFVYGSLKRGYRNHLAFCQGFELSVPATVSGRLYRQADGYPMLVVPEASILALGSADLEADFQNFAQVRAEFLKHSDSAAASVQRSPEADPTESWLSIRGEIYTWPADNVAENKEILSRLDDLEDFRPGRPDCLYHRAIVLAQHDAGGQPVWTYVAPGGELPPGVSPMGRSWP